MNKRSYRLNSLCLVAVSLLASSVNAEAPQPTQASIAGPTVYGPTVEGFQFEVSSDQSLYAAGAPIYIDVWLKNTTDAPLLGLYPTQTEEKLNISVTDSKGKSVRLTAMGSAGYVKPNFAQAFHPYNGPVRQMPNITIAAHQALHYRILVSRLFDMSKDGSYLISVSQWVAKQTKQDVSTISSPALTVSVSGGENNILTPGEINPPQYGGQGSPIGSKF